MDKYVGGYEFNPSTDTVRAVWWDQNSNSWYDEVLTVTKFKDKFGFHPSPEYFNASKCDSEYISKSLADQYNLNWNELVNQVKDANDPPDNYLLMEEDEVDDSPDSTLQISMLILPIPMFSCFDEWTARKRFVSDEQWTCVLVWHDGSCSVHTWNGETLTTHFHSGDCSSHEDVVWYEKTYFGGSGYYN